jgi:Undecaprenyl-phosphate glucose phosphotransferase
MLSKAPRRAFGGLLGNTALPLTVRAVPPLLAAVDLVVIVTLSVLSGLTYHYLVLQHPVGINVFFGSGLVVGALFVSLLYANDVYNWPRHTPRRFSVSLVWTLVFLFLIAVSFMLKMSEELSRGSIVLFYVIGLGVVTLVRAFMDRKVEEALSAQLLRGRRVALVADALELDGGELLQELDGNGCKIEKILVVPETKDKAVSETSEKPWLRELAASVRQTGADEVIIAVNWSRPAVVSDIAGALRKLPLRVSLVADRTARRLLDGQPTQIASLAAVELQRAPLTSLERTCKRCLDLFIAVCGGLVMLPLLGVVAIAIRIDSRGPVLFRQARMGFNGRVFRIYKFRTMTTTDDGLRVEQARRNDPRVTRVGYWLRRMSIDEVPQLLNVLKGEMSVVGPRPHALAHDNAYDEMIANYALRNRVKPGITGWAQVNGLRGETPTVDYMKRRVEHDLWYIDNWRLSLDFKILVRTVTAILKTSGVY